MASSARSPLILVVDDDVATTLLIQKGFQTGGADYISKPFAGEEVLARVSTHLRLKQVCEALAEPQAKRIQDFASAQERLILLPVERRSVR